MVPIWIVPVRAAMLGRSSGDERSHSQRVPLLVHDLLDISGDPGIDGVQQVPEPLPLSALVSAPEAFQPMFDLPSVIHQGGLAKPYRPAREHLHGNIGGRVMDEADVLGLDPIHFSKQVRVEQFGVLAMLRRDCHWGSKG
jgi:hypothetical protein